MMKVWSRESYRWPSFLCPACRRKKYGTGGTPTIGMTQEEVDSIRRGGGSCACQVCSAEPHTTVPPWAGQQDTRLRTNRKDD